MGCGCGGRAKARSLGTPTGTARQAQPATVTKYEVVVAGSATRFDTLLEARRYRNERGGTLRTVTAPA